MEIKLLNMTDYADIYGIYEAGKRIGTIEDRLAGCDVGTYATTYTNRYNKRELKKIWREAYKNNKIINATE